MRQITNGNRTANQQAGILAALGDLLRSQGVRTRLIRHITVRMTGFPVWEKAASELDIYGLGGQVATVTIDQESKPRRFLIKLPKSGTVVPLSSVDQPQSAVRWVVGWANGGAR
ncbi:hypothetical protein [Microbispora sp. KK1-11]|uniref:hypothetical protein n=1 Tax=Microbispora sp. KK1-11 TaxID=2053005 RepID=UPI00115A04C0|nr:hypothetical protein [Microbispora sp. KK1-11]TQS30100.1 hypothetical protein FLW16_07005 [Microbispora sp. KK1-11]